MTQRYPILVIGGYGNLGQRISQNLAQDHLVLVLIAGRSESKAKSLAQQLRNQYPQAKTYGLSLDIFDAKLTEKLAATGAELVIHAAGSFANQSEYPVVKACINAGVDYIDIANERDYVVNVQQFHEAADAGSLLISSGAGICPAISSAVIDHCQQRFIQIDQIKMNISFGNNIQCGLATRQYQLQHCGEAFEVWHNQVWESNYYGQDLQRHHYPHPLGKRWLGIIDTPGLALFPQRYPTAHSITTHASTGTLLQPWLYYLMTWLRRKNLVKDWSKVRRRTKQPRCQMIGLGSNRSALQISVYGKNQQNKFFQTTWYLLAQGNDSLQIIIAPAVVLAKKMARGEITQHGAAPCMGLLALEDIMASLSDYDIQQTYRGQ